MSIHRPYVMCLGVFVSAFGCARGDDELGMRSTRDPALQGTLRQTVETNTRDLTKTPAPDSTEAEIIALLQAMPSWERFSVFCEENAYDRERAQIEATIRRIASYDLDAVRRVLGYYYGLLDSGDGRAAEYPMPDFESKVFILNQFLFQLPKTVRRDSPHFRFFCGGWMGWPISGESGDPKASDEMDCRWPWSEDRSGRWHLTGQFLGYMGSIYRGDEPFDYFQKEFGRRRLVGEDGGKQEEHGG